MIVMIIKEQKLFSGEIVGLDFETINFEKVPAVTVATIMINNGYPVLERAHIINAISEMEKEETYCFYFPNAYIECNVHAI